jgi:AcrR family transcriptional regulator
LERTRYHHGDLRRALLEAAEAELVAAGLEAFSLRRVAKRAGVSHAAPAHHFGDVRGLLTALAAQGFERLVATQAEREAAAGADPDARLVASGVGYVDFAVAHPALFRLMFASGRPDHSDPHLKAAGRAAYRRLVDNVAAAAYGDSATDEPPVEAVMAAWSVAHGLADLIIGGQVEALAALAEPERTDAVAAILRGSLRGG